MAVGLQAKKNAADELWRFSCETYVAYKKEFGKEPAFETVYNGLKLGQWCNTQRYAFKIGALSDDRIKRLQAEDFVFEPSNEAWEQSFEAYVAYKQEFGNDPARNTVYNGLKLGNWCRIQRMRYSKRTLSGNRIKRLLAEGFVFKVRDAEWEHKFKAYVKYKRKFGREPAVKDVWAGINLGFWCCHQKQAYKNSKLSSERTRKLRDAGFPFEPKK